MTQVDSPALSPEASLTEAAPAATDAHVSAGAAVGGPEARTLGLAAGFAWGAGGFVSGIVFWHAFGFWSFVSEVVFKPAPEVAGVAVPGARVPGVEASVDAALGPGARRKVAGSEAARRSGPVVQASAPASPTPSREIPATTAALDGSRCAAASGERSDNRIVAFACLPAGIFRGSTSASGTGLDGAASGLTIGSASAGSRPTAAVAGWATQVEDAETGDGR